jgi:hypothetical protein
MIIQKKERNGQKHNPKTREEEEKEKKKRSNHSQNKIKRREASYKRSNRTIIHPHTCTS